LIESTPDRIVAAARLVRTGTTVSLGLPLDTEPRVDNPAPAEHRMTQLRFLCIVAPLRIPGGTGSPVNPIAIL
jgi:hypothetical protein